MYFYDPVKSIIGAAHAGWKGTVKQIGRIMTERWVNEEGSRLTDIQAVIGPSISAGSYTVDDRVINEVRAPPLRLNPLYAKRKKASISLI